MTSIIFGAGCLIFVLSAVVYLRASTLTQTIAGRALFATQVFLALALAATAFECRQETAWLWLAYAVVTAVSQSRASAMMVRSGLPVSGLARRFVKAEQPSA